MRKRSGKSFEKIKFMRQSVIFLFVSLSTFIFGQKKNFETLKLNLPKNKLEPQNVLFEINEIFLDKKKCFNYELSHDVEVDGRKIKNYYEIKTLDNNLLFSGEISNKNPTKVFENLITFHTLEKSVYKNSKIVGRNSLILNLSSNQVLNNDCSINDGNLKLFFERSNENK